jgi:ATP-dependent Zn protease
MLAANIEQKAQAVAIALIVTSVAFLVVPYGCNSLAPKTLPIPVEEQKAVAVHEAAHVVTDYAVNPDFQLIRVWVATDVATKKSLWGNTEYYAGPEPTTAEGRQVRAATMLSGGAAVSSLLDLKPKGCVNDLGDAREACRPRCPGNPNGACPHLVSISAIPGQPAQTQTERCLKAATQQAVNLVMDNADAIKSLADLIMSQPTKDNRRTLSVAQVKDFLRDKCIRGPAPATTSN